MTEYWVSNAKYWCDLCKCWLADTATAKANHEKGTGHKLNMQRKLREMRKAAADEKKEKAETKKALKKIEEAADNAFQKDMDKLDSDAPPLPPPAQPPPQLGKWERTDKSAYLYNATLRYYYDDKTGFYYGGDPPEWTSAPKIPEAAKFKGAVKEVKVIKGKLPDHLSNIGGHRAPVSGELTRGVLGQLAEPSEPGKRRREGDSSTPAKKAMTAQEEEEVRKREEARERVQKRTMATFGLS